VSYLIRLILFCIVAISAKRVQAQIGLSMVSNSDKAHVHRIDSLDEHKNALHAFKQQYADDTANPIFDTSKTYVMCFSDTIHFDKSDRRLLYALGNESKSIYQSDSCNLYYLSRTGVHDSIIYTPHELLNFAHIHDKWLFPVDTGSNDMVKVPSVEHKIYYPYFRPSMYQDKFLVLTQSQGSFGYNSIGLVNFSRIINHYFVVTD